MKAIIFDFGGVICTKPGKRPRDLASTKKLLDEAGLVYNEQELQNMVNLGMKEYKDYSYESWIELDSKGICEFIFKDLNSEKRDKLNQIADRVIEQIDIGSHVTEMEPHVKDVMNELKSRGYKIALISNTISPLVRDFVYDNLNGIFEYEIYSHEEKIRKPRTELFDAMSKKIDVENKDCVYIGDTFDKDVKGAKDAGYGMAILMDHSNRHQDKGAADYKISDLRELLDIFE